MIDDGIVLSWIILALMDHFTDVHAVAQTIRERPLGEDNATPQRAISPPAHLGADALLAKRLGELRETAEFEIAPEDEPDLLGFGCVHDELLIADLVPERHGSTHAQALLLRGGDLVADALARDLALEPGKREQDI